MSNMVKIIDKQKEETYYDIVPWKLLADTDL